MEVLGWRVWYDDGYVALGTSFDDWVSLASERPDKALVKMLYYDKGKQIQQADWWCEIPHPKGIIRRTCTDAQKPEIEKEHPEAVFIKGFWTADEWYREIVDKAMLSTWENLGLELGGYEGCCGG